MDEWDQIFSGNVQKEPVHQCPLLGTLADRNTALAFPSEANHCYKIDKPTIINLDHQKTYCLPGRHGQCPIFLGRAAAREASAPVPIAALKTLSPAQLLAAQPRWRRWSVVGPLTLLVVGLLVGLGLLLWQPDGRVREASNSLAAVKPVLADVDGEQAEAVAAERLPARAGAASTADEPPTAAAPPTADEPPTVAAPPMVAAPATVNLASIATPSPTAAPTEVVATATAISTATAVPTVAAAAPIVTLPTAQGWPAAPTAQPATAVIGPNTPPRSSLRESAAEAVVLSVHSGPGEGYAVLRQLEAAQSVTLLGRNETGSWINVRFSDGQEGWVNAAQAAVDSRHATADTTPGAPPTGAWGTAVVNTGALNVRNGPSFETPSLTVIYQGQSVIMLGRNRSATWIQIQLDSGLQGWVNATLVTPNLPLTSLPLVN